MLTVKREHELAQILNTIRNHLQDETFEELGKAITEFCCEISEEAFVAGKDEGQVEGYEDGYGAGYQDGNHGE